MVGLVIATHGQLARELIATAEQIIGKLVACRAVSIEPGASPEQLRDSLGAAVRDLDEGDGVIVLADLVGGTPCNQSLSLCSQFPIEVLTGVNLPMVLKASSLRLQKLPLVELASQLMQAGQKNITNASALLRPPEPSQR